MTPGKARNLLLTATSEQLLLLAVLQGSHLKSMINRELDRRRFGSDHGGGCACGRSCAA